MKKVYLDKADEKSCMSELVRGAEVIAAGTTVYSMSAKNKNREYQRFADKYSWGNWWRNKVREKFR